MQDLNTAIKMPTMPTMPATTIIDLEDPPPPPPVLKRSHAIDKGEYIEMISIMEEDYPEQASQ